MAVRWCSGRALAGALSLLLGAVVAGCAPAAPQSWWADSAGPVAEIQGGLFRLTAVLGLIVLVLVGALLGYAVVRFRSRPGQGLPAQIHGSHKLEVIWTIIPILILLIIAVPTVGYTFRLANPPATADALTVRVVANQWWWAFEYPELGVVTANEMHIPVGRTIRLELESNDVIHSFWVPKLAGKTDVIPGQVNTMWLQAEEVGEFYGHCVELCGASHAKMRFRVIVDTQDEFEAWVDKLQAPPPAAENAMVRQGEELFMGGKPCYSCHAIAGTKAQGVAGPNLTALGIRTTIAAGVLDNTEEHLAAWLRDPQAVKPGSRMPNLGLTEDEIAALVAYLHSLE